MPSPQGGDLRRTARSGARALPADLLALLLERAPAPLRRRRYMVAVLDDPAAHLVARDLERNAGAVSARTSDCALLIERSVAGFSALGSMRVAELATESGPAVELSHLFLPADPWHSTGALTEGNLLLLHAGIRHARLRQASVLSLLAEPTLLASLVRATSFFRPALDRPAPAGLVWATARPSGRGEVRGFEAVLVEGVGLSRLALFIGAEPARCSAAGPPVDGTNGIASGPDLEAAAGR